MSYIGNPIVSTDFPVNYFSGNGSTTAFTLSIAPASVNSLDVQVSGVSQSPQTYTVSGTTLTFSAAPPTGSSNIVVRHLGIAGIPNTPSVASVTSSSLSNLTTLPVSGGYTATLPSVTGTVMVSGNMPAFSAYNTVATAITASTTTLIPFNNKTGTTASTFDTAGCYNNTNATVTLNGISTPAYSFAPNVAGYYQFNTNVGVYYPQTNTYVFITFVKNGSNIYQTLVTGGNGTSLELFPTGSVLVYMNGTSDTICVKTYTNSTGTTIDTGIACIFSGCLVRSA